MRALTDIILTTDDLATEIYGSGFYFLNREQYNIEKEKGKDDKDHTSLKETADPQLR
jgi:hypothetical protein